MRTTLTVDNDLLDKARKAAERQRKPVKTIINDALRLGLEKMRTDTPKPYILKPRKLSRHASLLDAKINDLLEHAEGNRFK